MVNLLILMMNYIIIIYFNDNKREIKNKYKYKINKKDKVTKIKIIID